jgi:aliphatic nitrilase
MADAGGEIRLGAAQVAEVYLDREATVEKDCRYIREAGELGVDLLVFPEFHVAGSPYWAQYDDDFDGFQEYYRALFEAAVEVPGPATDRLCEAAREANVAVVVGVNEREAGTAGTMYNSQVFVDADGTLLGVRRKLAPTREERLYHAGGTGEDVRTFESSLGTLGGLMCGEHTNPLAVYATLALGEELHAAAWPAMPQPERDPAFRERHIYARTRYHAFAGKMPTAAATGVVTDELAEAVGGMPEAYADSGTSGVLGPDGSFLAGPKAEGEGIVHASVDPGDRIEGKAYHDVTGHYNRFDVFELTVDRRPQPSLVTVDGDGGDRDVAAALATLRAAADRRDDPDLADRVQSLAARFDGTD